MSIYEEKMPAYLAMSRGDLIAEVLEQGEIGHRELEGGKEKPSEEPSERVRIANDVLRERFGVTISFYGDYPNVGGDLMSALLGGGDAE